MSALYLCLVNRLMAMRREEGQTLTEYALILVLIAIVAIVTVMALGTQVAAVFETIRAALVGGT